MSEICCFTNQHVSEMGRKATLEEIIEHFRAQGRDVLLAPLTTFEAELLMEANEIATFIGSDNRYYGVATIPVIKPVKPHRDAVGGKAL